MNPRIRELLPKPWTFPYPDREMYSKEQMVEFAELIVQECIDVAKKQHNPAALNYKPSERFVEALQQHFGVEE